MKKLLISASVCLFSIAATAQETQWYLRDKTDNTAGISVERTYRELLKDRKPTPVIVAVIDGGIDTTHEDLKRVLWINPKEVAGNGKDDDNNGYVDDVHGWNFIGGKDGRNVSYETAEVTRLYAQLKPKYEGKTRSSLKPDQQKEYDLYVKTKAEVEKNQAQYKAQYQGISQFYEQYTTAVDVLKKALNVTKLDTTTLQKAADTLTDANLKRPVAGILRLLKQQGASDADAVTSELEKANEQLKSRAEYNYNPDFDSRAIVGDNPNDMNQRDYGNADIAGPRADHGTHVAGIIGADRTNNLGIMGISDAVQIMGVRAVPDGDERDKDIANAIRYAVDNGAQIINMSFGKDYSPQRKTVEDAERYALSKGVLMVHAAGNDGKDIDTAANYPAPRFMDGKEIPNVITVGASAETNNSELVASFSNYGKQTVDVFAPGKDIYSTVPGSKYENNSGTSMASPVVAGVAAVLKSYFPKLTYADIKRIIMQSATPYKTKVRRPESTDTVEFSSLSKTGGVVNLYDAVKLALAQEGSASKGK
ncbi:MULTISPECIES: S8 family peptidase [Spirosoma]|uniref:S8 family peptidase n=1 Tax=Spirosoma liriopis TaxID=2937440 RepID=A0ABT0HK09_9BACT|nr:MULTISPECIES: S8 family peptidase [Spirosoma]MCK8492477.1 S8 family peptidase [Spirosoma liriopis]UHG91948.1 S8 family peptidase [Spirosoma oryzicola]